MNVLLLAPAQAELDEVISWYAAQAPGLGNGFWVEVLHSFQLIASATASVGWRCLAPPRWATTSCPRAAMRTIWWSLRRRPGPARSASVGSGATGRTGRLSRGLARPLVEGMFLVAHLSRHFLKNHNWV